MSKKTIAIILIIILLIVAIICSCVGMIMIFSNGVSNSSLESSDDVGSEKVLIDGEKEKIVVIDVKGIIMDTDTSNDLWGNSFAGSGQIVKQLDQAKNDENVKAVILDINSPGGGVYASDVIYEKIKEVQASGKPVIALMREMAASGGYYISAPADKIVADELTITGSIGVLIEFTSLEGLYDKAGIETKTITNTGGTFKTDAGLFDSNPNGEDEKIMQKLVDEAYNQFVSIVSDGRNMSVEDVKKLADGRIYTGSQAKNNGLVDELGKFDKAVEVAEKEANISDATVIKYEKQDFWSLLTQSIGPALNPVAKLFQDGDITPGAKLQYMMK